MDMSSRYEIDKRGRHELFEQSKQALLECAQTFAAEHALRDLAPVERRAMFPAFVRYARKELQRIPPDVLLIDELFDVYLDLCVAFDYTPTVYSFAELLCIDSIVINWEYDISQDIVTMINDDDIKSTISRKAIVKSWKQRCAAFLVNRLANTDGASVNRIFISKAIYGLRDDAPQQEDVKTGDVVRVDALPTLAIDDKPYTLPNAGDMTQ